MDASRLIETWMVSQRTEELDDVVLGVSQGHLILLDIVKALGGFLTAEDDDLRSRGIKFLSSVVGLCPPETINHSSTRVLVTFYCSKLHDIATTAPSLEGLASLAALPTCTSNDAKDILQSLFGNVKMKSLVQSVRFLVFKIIDTLLSNHRQAIRNLGNEFLSSYINLAEGEKDPRNLIVAFAIARVILIEFDISECVESLFDIVFCYFPITFRPPPNDPYGISADDLRNALGACLNATPAFGPLALPLFLDKLTAGSPITKRDSLQAIADCLPMYGLVVARQFASQLWSSLKLEIFQPTDPETEKDALNTLQVLIETLYSDKDLNNETLDGLAVEACSECNTLLDNPEKAQAKSAMKVLSTFLVTKPSVSRHTLATVIPHLASLFLDPDEISNQPAVLHLLSDFLMSVQTAEAGEKVDTSSITPFKDTILNVLTIGLSASSSRCHALKGLRAAVTITGFLVDEELGIVVRTVGETIRSNDDLFDEASITYFLELLSAIAYISPRHIDDQTLPLLFGMLPNCLPTTNDVVDRAKVLQTMSILSDLCATHAEFFDSLVVQLFSRIDRICAHVSERADISGCSFFVRTALTSIAKALATKVSRKGADIANYVDRLVPNLFEMFVYATVVKHAGYIPAADHEAVATAGYIISLVIGSLSASQQEKFAIYVFEGYVSGHFTAKTDSPYIAHRDVPFQPLQLSLLQAKPDHLSRRITWQKNLVVLFSAALVAFLPETTLPLVNTRTFLSEMMRWSIEFAENAMQRNAMWHIIASLVNKGGEGVSSFLSEDMRLFWIRAITNDAQMERRIYAVKTWAWVTKALVCRSHDDSLRFAERLISLFADSSINVEAATTFGMLCSTDNVLTKKNHAVIKVLHAQRFYVKLLPRIIEGEKTTIHSEKVAFLIALVSLLKSLPQATYMPNLPLIAPLLLHALQVIKNEARVDAIDIFLSIASAKDSAIANQIIREHASTLISLFLSICQPRQGSSVNAQLAALRFLRLMPATIQHDILQQYKPLVIRQLANVLDDPKRSVRKEAVDARTSWFKCNG